MSANPIWIAGYFGPVAGASPVWIAPGDGTVPSAVQSEIVSYYAPVAGATAVWVAGFFAPPPAVIGATPITISGWGGSGGGGPIHSAEALAYLARTVGGNEGGNGENIATLIDGLVSDGVWAKLDALYVLAQQNQTDALLNLVGTSYSLAASLFLDRVASFTSYVGFNNFGILNTNFDPTVAPSPHYIMNDAGFGVWTYAVIQEDYPQIGQFTADTSASIYNKFTDGTFISVVNGGGYSRTPSTITEGLFAAERFDASNVHPYQNGVSAGAIASASAPVRSAPFVIGNVNGPSAQTLSAAFIGASLGAAGQLALYNRLRTYMTAVGVP